MAYVHLTPTEWKILRLIVVDGMTAKEISQVDSIAESTIGAHLRSIRDKVGARTTAAIGHRAHCNGLLDKGGPVPEMTARQKLALAKELLSDPDVARLSLHQERARTAAMKARRS